MTGQLISKLDLQEIKNTTLHLVADDSKILETTTAEDIPQIPYTFNLRTSIPTVPMNIQRSQCPQNKKSPSIHMATDVSQLIGWLWQQEIN